MKTLIIIIISALTFLVATTFLTEALNNKKKENNTTHYKFGVLVAQNIIYEAEAMGEKRPSVDTILARSKRFLYEHKLDDLYIPEKIK